MRGELEDFRFKLEAVHLLLRSPLPGCISTLCPKLVERDSVEPLQRLKFQGSGLKPAGSGS